MPKKIKTTLLVIIDGFGIGNAKDPGNPITPKTAPNYFAALKQFPHGQLEASGASVGLFPGQEGNSEAGHLNLGAGRVVKQDAVFISDAIADGTFFKNHAFEHAVQHVQQHKSAVHLMGLLSNHNSAHSCPDHLQALLEFFYKKNIKKVFMHLFTDGRDSGQYQAHKHLRLLKKFFHGQEKIATISGRYYAMDRNKNWERTRQAYEAMVLGKGRTAASAEEALRAAYALGDTDEYVAPTIILENGQPAATIKDNDAVVFFNLRSDRARQLAKSFTQTNFKHINLGAFSRVKFPKNICFVALTDFGPDLPGVFTAFPSRDVSQSLAQALCPHKQLYAAESEKFSHITYFFNGGYAQHFCDEKWVKIASPEVKNYADKPEMSAKQLTDYVVGAIESQKYEFIAVNFANLDMVGHTGDFVAAQKAVSTVDAEMARMIQVLIKHDGQAVITADHGNIEEMMELEHGEPNTEHSVNPVPLIIINSRIKMPRQLPKGKLANVAPTILKMMGIKKPKEMTSASLI